MNESKEPRPMQSSDHIPSGLTEALGAQVFSDGEVKGVRVVDFSGQRLVADLRDDGSVFVRIEGKGIPGSTDELAACGILVARLNRDNIRWKEPQARPKDEEENGVDVVAKPLGDGKLLLFQVTRIDPDPQLWADLANTGFAEKVYPVVDDVADALKEAIFKKRNRPQKDIILVLNGTQLPIGLPAVRAAFENRHGQWVRTLQFDEVWVVESFLDEPWTYRLFPASG